MLPLLVSLILFRSGLTLGCKIFKPSVFLSNCCCFSTTLSDYQAGVIVVKQDGWGMSYSCSVDPLDADRSIKALQLLSICRSSCASAPELSHTREKNYYNEKQKGKSGTFAVYQNKQLLHEWISANHSKITESMGKKVGTFPLLREQICAILVMVHFFYVTNWWLIPKCAAVKQIKKKQSIKDSKYLEFLQCCAYSDEIPVQRERIFMIYEYFDSRRVFEGWQVYLVSEWLVAQTESTSNISLKLIKFNEKITIILNESYKSYVWMINVHLMALKPSSVGRGWVLLLYL